MGTNLSNSVLHPQYIRYFLSMYNSRVTPVSAMTPPHSSQHSEKLAKQLQNCSDIYQMQTMLVNKRFYSTQTNASQKRKDLARVI